MIGRRYVLHFPKKLVDQPIICKLSKEYDLEFNILKASVTPDEEGLLVLELKGDEGNLNRAINYLQEIGVKIQPLSKDLVKDESKCTHCGLCIVYCPSGALYMKEDFEVIFESEKCIGCEICVKICPYGAMKVYF